MPMQPETITIRCAAAVAPPEGGRPRSISGTIATYGEITHPYGPWDAVRLTEGAISWPDDARRVKLLAEHDRARIIGSMTSATVEDGALKAAFDVAATADASDMISLAKDGHLDGLSVGLRVTDGKSVLEDGQDIFDVTAAELYEVSLVGWPADTTARVESVAASKKGNPMPTTAENSAPTPAPLDENRVTELVRAAMDESANAPQRRALPLEPGLTLHQGVPVSTDGTPIAVRAVDRPQRYAGVWARGKYITAGDYFASYARGTLEGDWSQHQTIRAALQDEVTGDVPGLLPQQIVGELLGRASGRRPLWDSFSSRDMPMVGATFARPMITQHVLVSPQTAEKTEVASQKYKVALANVPKVTLGGALDVSQQALDWTSPALLNELIADFTRVYIARTDLLAATNLVTAATTGASTVAWDGTAATLQGVLAEAAGAVYQSVSPEVDVYPNTVWLSVDVWVDLAGLTDTTGRPLLPALGPNNATGTISLSNPETGVQGNGFRWVVDKNLPARTMIMGDSQYTESYENGRRFLQAVRPDVLGLDLAYMGYVATYFPYPASLVKITVPVVTPTSAKTK